MKCEDCNEEMIIIDTRADGCRCFFCEKCGSIVAEETEEWFEKMGVIE